MHVPEGSFGCPQSLFFVGDRYVCLDWKYSAEALVSTLIGAREETPGIGEALN
jgi:hypothetical protein